MYELNVIKAQILHYRIDILHQGGKFYNDDWCKLREWSRTFQQENQGSLVDIQVDDDGKFLRMFVSVKPCIDIALACGMQFSAGCGCNTYSTSPVSLWNDTHAHHTRQSQ